MPKTIAELYAKLAQALQELEDAGEQPARGFTRFADGSQGLAGKSGSVRRADDEWLLIMEGKGK